MPEADRRQIGLDGACRQPLFLHKGDIGGKVFSGEIGKLLHAMIFCDEFQKTTVGFKVSFPCFEAPLTVVPEELPCLFIKRLISVADKGSSLVFGLWRSSPNSTQGSFPPGFCCYPS